MRGPKGLFGLPLGALAVAGATLAVILIGFLGRVGPAPVVPLVPEQSLVTTGPAVPSPTPTADGTSRSSAGPDSLPLLHGLAARTIAVGSGSLREASLPAGAQADLFAFDGTRAYFATYDSGRGGVDEVDLARPGLLTVLTSLAPCHEVVDLATAFGRVIWVEAWLPSIHGIPASGCRTDHAVPEAWRVWLVDRAAQPARLVASGTSLPRPAASDGPAPALPHVALASTGYAVVRPAANRFGPARSTIEVRAFDNKTVWQVPVAGEVGRVELGGERLAFVQGRGEVFVATRTRPAPAFMADSNGDFSLSRDGRYLSWDGGPAVWLADFTARATVVELISPHVDSVSGESANHAAVGAGQAGPAMFWRGTAADGSSYLVVRPSPQLGSLVVVDAPAPSAGSIDGDLLIWRSLVTLPDGIPASSLFGLDLTRIRDVAAEAGGPRRFGPGVDARR